METYEGVAASAGIGIGRVMLVEPPVLDFEEHVPEDTAAEVERLHAAIAAFCEDTAAKAEAVRANLGDKEADIISGHALMISDPYMQQEMVKLIEGGACAESACSQICGMFAQMFGASDNELTRQRVTDVEDIRSGVLVRLLNKREADVALAPPRTVLVTHDLTPSMIASMDRRHIVGIVTEVGGQTSHSAILARAMELPAVLAVPGICKAVSNPDRIIVDGSTGRVLVDPDPSTIRSYKTARHEFIARRQDLQRFVGNRTTTADGHLFELLGNIGRSDDAAGVLEHDGEGIGLFRTEFLFMDSQSMPTEEEQFEAYRKVALVCKGKPVIIRTLDIGGDKDIPYLGLQKEDNPFLGFRAIRFCLQREDVYRTQLRALLRASAYGDIRIMVPLVTCVDEVVQVRELIRRYMEEFDREGIRYNADIRVGIMVETPAAALVADLLATEADFFSIGTNDLTGYTMAVDRGNDKVRYLYSTYNPAVLRSIRRIIECGHAAGIPVGMCGEAAADPLLVPMWVAFGLDEYSVSPSSILATRKEIFGWTVSAAGMLAEEVMTKRTAGEVYETLRAAVGE